MAYQGNWGGIWSGNWLGALGYASVDVRVSWVQFDTAASPVDVRVSWLEFDTSAIYATATDWIVTSARRRGRR